MDSQEIFFFLFFCIMVSMATNENEQWAQNYMTDRRLPKRHFYTKIFNIIAMAWQKFTTCNLVLKCHLLFYTTWFVYQLYKKNGIPV